MDILIWSGAALSAIGLVGILWSAAMVNKARKAGLSDDDLKARIGKMLPVNLGALFVSVFGLMCVILGISLG